MLYIISECNVFTVTDCKPQLDQYSFKDILNVFHDEDLEGYCAVPLSAIELEKFLNNDSELKVEGIRLDYKNALAIEYLLEAVNEYISAM